MLNTPESTADKLIRGLLKLCVDRGCAAEVGDMIDGCDSDSDDCESVASDVELKAIYSSDEPPAKRLRFELKTIETEKKISQQMTP